MPEGNNQSKSRKAEAILAELEALSAEDLSTLATAVDRELSRRGLDSMAVHANRFLDAIIENIPDMIFVKDARRLAFQRFNRAGEQLLGTSRSQLIGKNDYDFFPKDQAEFFQAKDRATLSSKTLLDILEEPIETKNGLRWLHTKKVPILDENGEPIFLLGISEDITERKAVQAALVRAKEAAEAASRELEAFSYSVAHDLRAPLRAIDGFSQALLEDHGAVLDDEGRGFLNRLRAAAQDMARLIDDLLNLSRMTRSELRRVSVDVSALAQASASRAQQTYPGHVVELSIQAGLFALADAQLLSVVFNNLLANAWKFTRHTRGARIEVGSLHEDNEQVFFVRDNGAGFDMAYAKKLFGVFQRLHTASEFEGSGIGLATVQRVVQRHGGRIWAIGAVGEGATFLFTVSGAGREEAGR
ncbi:MAG TPA: ATP-binding protein [Polyangia bacterium]|nr:ATP-binding protein [Polyangia bacterium]